MIILSSIYFIFTNPKHWHTYLTSKRLKEKYSNEPLYNVRYGVLDDDPDGTTDLEMLMRESVYQKVMSGEYTVSQESKYRHKLILVDKNQNPIQPISDICY